MGNRRRLMDIRGRFFLSLLGGLALSAVAGAPASAATDLAQNRSATASSSEIGHFEAINAIDNDSETRWSSAFGDGQSWRVDLGTPQEVDQVWINWEHAYASHYVLQVSTDGTNYTTVWSGGATEPGWKAHDFAPQRTRYVRFYGDKRATPWGFSFWDFVVYNTGESDSAGLVGSSPSGDVEPDHSVESSILVDGEPAVGTVIASSDFEDGTRGGMNVEQCYPGDLSFPSGGAAQGNRLGSYMVREGFNDRQTGHARCESARWDVPSLQTYYTRAWIRVPSHSEFSEWLTTIQWKTIAEPPGPPPLDLFLLPPKYRGDEYLSLRSGDSTIIAWDSPTVQRDKWYRIVVKTYLNPDPALGWEEVWFGDASGVTKQTMANGQQRFYQSNAVANSDHHFRFGIRRADVNTGTTVVDYDDISIDRASP